MTLLEINEICKKYSGRKRKTEALKNISFSLDEGEILGIVGESGSGKSTLLKIISGLEAADSGEIIFRGIKLDKKRNLEQLRMMQMIFQDAAGSFHPRRRVGDSIKDSVRSLYGSGKKLDLDKLCQTVGLNLELAGRFPRELSGGQCQRFAIARATAAEPELLLCDEATSALDVLTQAQIIQLLEEICCVQKMSMIFVSHDLAAVSSLCSRILVMKNGEIIEKGNTADIFRNPQQEYTKFLVGSAMAII